MNGNFVSSRLVSVPTSTYVAHGSRTFRVFSVSNITGLDTCPPSKKCRQTEKHTGTKYFNPIEHMRQRLIIVNIKVLGIILYNLYNVAT